MRADNVCRGDYWSFNLAGSYLPIVLLKNNVSSGATNVTNTYREYIYIYTPGIIGAILAFMSVQLPLVGRKWSLVLSAACQGLAMAMYTQVKTTPGYVGLNALEYIMQTVSGSQCRQWSSRELTYDSISTPSYMPQLRSCSTRPSVAVPVVCSHAWVVSLVSWHHSQVSHLPHSSHPGTNSHRRRAIHCQQQCRNLVARCWWHLALCLCHDLFARRNEEQADVLECLIRRVWTLPR